jgi:hypothetical protein
MNALTDEELAELNSHLIKRIRRLEYRALSRPVHEAAREDMMKVQESMKALLAGPRADTKASHEKLLNSLDRADEVRQRSIEQRAEDLALHTNRTAAIEDLLVKVSPQ